MSDAAAHVTLLFAMSGSSVIGTDTADNTAEAASQFKGPHAKK
jgi:hypothetical protein